MQISKQILIALSAVLLVAGFVAGFFTGGNSRGYNLLSGGGGQIASEVSSQLLGLSGSVTKVEGSVITLDTSAMPLIGNMSAARLVEVVAETVIVKQTAKSQTQIEQELAAYRKKLAVVKEGTPIPPAPSPNLEETIKLGDIKTGDTLSVEAGSDIKTAAKFVATKITVMPVINVQPVTVPTPPAQ